MEKQLPVVFLLDLDRTIIGDPEHILDYKTTMEFIINAKASEKITEDQAPAAELKAIPSWKELFVPEFFRPGLKHFLEETRRLMPTAEFFIYSSGTKEYVENMMTIVEKQIGVKFHRPLLSRTECPTDETNHYTKSIISQFPKIIRALSRDPAYDELNLEEYAAEIMENRVIFIDDSDFVWDRKEKWIKAPTYDYRPMFDMDDRLLRIIHRTPLIQEYLRSSKANQTLYIHENEKFSYDEYRMNYHLFMANIYREQAATNRKSYDQDTFFERLLKSIKPYKGKAKPFKTVHLQAIQRSIR
jgi:NLI interacting factor-like phosphatase